MKQILILILLYLLYFQSSAQGNGWEWLNPKPQGNQLNEVKFIDSQTGWAVGNYGTILKTTNGGTSWTPQPTGKTYDFLSLFFIDSQTGWVVGKYKTTGVIIKTTDGGTTWTEQQLPWVDYSFQSVFFIDSLTGWITSGYWGAILKTTDGGLSWIQQTQTSSPLYSIFFIDSQTGWAVGGTDWPLIYKTSNGGSTWTYQSPGPNPNHLLQSVFFLDHQMGWVAGDGHIRKTINGGLTWTLQFTGSFSFSSIYFTDPQNGWATSNAWAPPKLLKTTNGGQTWAPVEGFHSPALQSIVFVDSLTGWVAGSGGTIKKTTDGGLSWASQIDNPSLNRYGSFCFVDSLHGWMSGIKDTLFKTTNGGTSWTKVTTGGTERHGAISFIDTLNGWALGGDGEIVKTTDGGATWEMDSTEFLQNNCLYRLNAQTAFIGDYYGIQRTFNGGGTWSSHYVGNGYEIVDFCFVNSLVGWAVGESGSILKTTNGGVTWTKQTNGVVADTHFGSVHFIDTQRGWVVGSDLKIQRTIDGGATWTSQNLGATNGCCMTAVHFTDSLTGWIVCSMGVFKTINGGNIWALQDVGTNNDLDDIVFTTPRTGLLSGSSYGTLLKTTTGGMPCPVSVSLFISGSTTLTSGQSVVFTSSSSFGNQWYVDNQPIPGATGITYTASTSGSYHVRVTDLINTCAVNSTPIQVNVIQPLFITHQPENVFVQVGGMARFKIEVQGTGATYKWQADTGTGFHNLANTGQYMGAQGRILNIYNLSLANTGELFRCIVQEGWFIDTSDVAELVVVTAINKELKSPNFSIYPNPSENEIQLITKYPILATSITDALGRECTVPPSGVRGLDIRSLKPGLYWVKVQTAEGVSVQKLIKR